ncbi:MAG: hypothetical protein K2L78_07855, partial [Muribaculaceae bacterium]|nr:hypothetical protein [Muribaculaceae bacterium]
MRNTNISIIKAILQGITSLTFIAPLLMASVSVQNARSVPAKSGPVAMESDGDTITVYLHGDEHFHYR